MVGIGSNVGVQTQQPKKSNKVLKHMGNATVTTAALGATGYGTYKSLIMLGNAAKFLDGQHYYSSKFAKSFGLKFHKVMSNVGNKIFPKGGMLHNDLLRYVKTPSWFGGVYKKSTILASGKGAAALLLGAGITALAILGRSLYKAGKINGEG